MITPTRFSIIPPLTILDMGTYPDPNTMALGGVATGSMNAHDAEMVAGIISRRGFSFRAIAVPIITGNRAAVVAVLLVNSVKYVISRHIIATTSRGWIFRSGLMPCPRMRSRPVSLNPPAMAKPPPNKSRIPQALKEVLQPDDIAVFIGAGDISKYSRLTLEELKR